MSKKRAFVRYNKKGILAPGSLVVTNNYPSRSGNLWYEVPVNLLGGVTLTSSFNTSSLPWNVGGSAVELNMGCMSNTADWLSVYAPIVKDLETAADVISHMNAKLSFLGTFELSKDLGEGSIEIIFNLSPQLAEDLNKPQSTDGAPCGFSISFWD
jgi:hypothetical protein